MKKRNMAVGGSFLIVGAIAIWLAGLLSGLGISNGDGDGEVQVSLTPDMAGALGETDNSPPSEPQEMENIKPVSVVSVRIDGQDYEVENSKGSSADFAAIDLDSLMQLIEAAPGDENGLRVRIARQKSSRVSAEKALEKALEEVGLNEEQVLWYDAWKE